MKLIGQYKDILSILIALAVWFAAPHIALMLDPTSRPFDAGLFQALIFGVVAFLLAQAVAWNMIRFIWPALYSYFKHEFSSTFKNQTSCVRLIISLSVYFSLFALLILAMHIML